MTTLLLLTTLAAPSVAADLAIVATQLTPANIGSLQPGGPDATAGIGDWLLGNGTLCAAVSDIDHETGLTPFGGSLIDVYHCAENDDQWTFQNIFPNIDKDQPLTPSHISASQDGQMAQLEVVAGGHGLELRSHYRLDLRRPEELIIEHELTRLNEGLALTMFGFMTLHPHLSLLPFSLSSNDAQYNKGFKYESWDRTDTLSTIGAMIPADTHVLVGSAELGQVSYGVQLRAASLTDLEGVETALPRFTLTDPTYSVQGVMTRPPWLGGSGKLGLLEFAQSRLMDINPGETLRIVQAIWMGDRADVASVTDHIYRGPYISGTLESDLAVVHVSNKQGVPLTAIRPDPDGRFRARLPQNAGKIALSVHTPWADPQEIIVADTNNGMSGGETAIPQSYLTLPQLQPMRLIFLGLNGTPNPDFYDNLMGFESDGEPFKDGQSANYISLAGVAGDPSIIPLRPGKYRVLASHGMSFSVTETEISLGVGERLTLDIDPPIRELSAPGWLGADLHVHSAPSFDSYTPVDDRLRSFVAQGSDVLVATEHDVLVNYDANVERLGLEKTLKVINGTELTGLARTPALPYTNGHMNIFPAARSPEQYAGGIFPHEGIRLRSIYAEAKERFGKVLFQLNHPRLTDPAEKGSDSAYFEHLVDGVAFNPAETLDSDANRSLIEPDPTTGLRDLDFDVMEVANGDAYESYKHSREDWFSLLNQGEKIVGSANSDSHGSKFLVAIPQNYVQLTDDYSEPAFIEAVRRGRVVGSTGPMLHVHASSATQEKVMLGETVDQGQFTLHIRVEAASWIPVEQLTVFLNGSVYHQQTVERGQQLTLPISTEADGFVIVEVTAEAGQLYGVVAPGFKPFAFSNPIFIDAADK